LAIRTPRSRITPRITRLGHRIRRRRKTYPESQSQMEIALTFAIPIRAVFSAAWLPGSEVFGAKHAAIGTPHRWLAGGHVDDDLDGMAREQLIAEVRRLRAGIRSHRDSTGQDLCWHHPALWGLLPERTDPVPTVPTWPEFLRGCVRYRQTLDEQLPGAPRSDAPYQPATPSTPGPWRSDTGHRQWQIANGKWQMEQRADLFAIWHLSSIRPRFFSGLLNTGSTIGTLDSGPAARHQRRTHDARRQTG
jgi:hypothetical protein